MDVTLYAAWGLITISALMAGMCVGMVLIALIRRK